MPVLVPLSETPSLATFRWAPVRVAPAGLAPRRSAPSRWAPVWSRSRRLTPDRLAPWRLAPRRSPLRSIVAVVGLLFDTAGPISTTSGWVWGWEGAVTG